MILASYGLRTYVFENEDLNLCDLTKSYRGMGYCFDIATYPAQDQGSVTAINNVAALGSVANKSTKCFINYDPDKCIWAICVEKDSDLYDQIMQYYMIDNQNGIEAISTDEAIAGSAEYAKKIAKLKAFVDNLGDIPGMPGV